MKNPMRACWSRHRGPSLPARELAARYRDGTLWTYGDHASGDDSGACYDDGSILGGPGMPTVSCGGGRPHHLRETNSFVVFLD